MREQLKVLRKKSFSEICIVGSWPCWNLETKWEGKCGVKKDAAVQSVTSPAGDHICVSLQKTPLVTDPPWTWQTWGFSSQLEAITIRDSQWTPWAWALPDPYLLSSGLLWEVSTTAARLSHTGCPALMKRWLNSKAGQPCAQVHLLFYQVTVTNELPMLLRWIPFFAACVISHKILTFSIPRPPHPNPGFQFAYFPLPAIWTYMTSPFEKKFMPFFGKCLLLMIYEH